MTRATNTKPTPDGKFYDHRQNYPLTSIYIFPHQETSCVVWLKVNVVGKFYSSPLTKTCFVTLYSPVLDQTTLTMLTNQTLNGEFIEEKTMFKD